MNDEELLYLVHARGADATELEKALAERLAEYMAYAAKPDDEGYLDLEEDDDD